MSVPGTKRTWRDVRLESVMRSIADMGNVTWCAAHTRLASMVCCVDDEITEWLEWRERRKRDRLAGGRQSV
jgi:hypothetical protein